MYSLQTQDFQLLDDCLIPRYYPGLKILYNFYMGDELVKIKLFSFI